MTNNEIQFITTFKKMERDIHSLITSLLVSGENLSGDKVRSNYNLPLFKDLDIDDNEILIYNIFKKGEKGKKDLKKTDFSKLVINKSYAKSGLGLSLDLFLAAANPLSFTKESWWKSCIAIRNHIIHESISTDEDMNNTYKTTDINVIFSMNKDKYSAGGVSSTSELKTIYEWLTHNMREAIQTMKEFK